MLRNIAGVPRDDGHRQINVVCQERQATVLDARASRVK